MIWRREKLKMHGSKFSYKGHFFKEQNARVEDGGRPNYCQKNAKENNTRYAKLNNKLCND